MVQTLIFTDFNTPLHSQPVKYVMKPLEIHRNMDATTALIKKECGSHHESDLNKEAFR